MTKTTSKQLEECFSKMILSASGFRKVFSEDKNPESSKPGISYEDKLICVAVAKAFFTETGIQRGQTVLLARDARPTGKEICTVIGRTLIALGAVVSYAGICSAPEIMAQSTYSPYAGFAYVSASHNPIGHNGFKFGKDGGVYGQGEIAPVIEKFRSNIKDLAGIEKLYNDGLAFEVEEDIELKKACLENYEDFVRKTFTVVPKNKVSVVADLNGSARAASIDKHFLTSLGVQTAFINYTAGLVAHGIIPEGENLEPCCDLLEKMHALDDSFILGYVPDNDGDRGNLVYTDDEGKAYILMAQEVFALCVYSTLLRCKAEGRKNVAIAVNGPTSLRIDEIAKQFDAKVFRSEVGEANTVNLADKLRKEGYCVLVSGEGSNGGNISYPARVRDPMNTLMCMFNILQYSSIQKALEKLPVYTTTSTTDPRAIIKLKTSDYPALKAEYEKIFREEFETKKRELALFGISSYLEYQTEGIVERQQAGNGDKGGLKMVFLDSDCNKIGYVWMRPSGTEPLFRVMCDLKGSNTELHDKLLKWHRDIIFKAQDRI